MCAQEKKQHVGQDTLMLRLLQLGCGCEDQKSLDPPLLVHSEVPIKHMHVMSRNAHSSCKNACRQGTRAPCGVGAGACIAQLPMQALAVEQERKYRHNHPHTHVHTHLLQHLGRSSTCTVLLLLLLLLLQPPQRVPLPAVGPMPQRRLHHLLLLLSAQQAILASLQLRHQLRLGQRQLRRLQA